MPIDASIALQGKLPQFESPLNALAQVSAIQGAQNQNRLADYKISQAQREDADTLEVRNVLAGAGGDLGAGTNALMSKGFYKQALELRKTQGEQEKTRGDLAKQKTDLIDSKLKQSRAFLDGVTTPEQYIAWHEANHKDDVLGPALAVRGITAETARASIMKALNEPGGFETLLNQSRMGIEKFADANKPVIQTRNTGGTTDTMAINPFTGKATVTGSVANTQSPDSIASATSAAAGRTVTMRGQDMVDARTREAATAKAATDKAPTEFQGKAAGYGARAEQADKIITELGDSYSPAGINTKQQLGKVWGVGGALEAGANLVLPANSQKAEQAQRDFINAVLRQESGAAIADAEFANAKKQYFPQPGDGKDVIAQKAQNRKLAIQGFKNSAGKAAFSAPENIDPNNMTPEQAKKFYAQAEKQFGLKFNKAGAQPAPALPDGWTVKEIK